jgi:hypothetical protein
MLSILGLIPTILTALTGLGSTASSISKDIRDLQIAKEKTKSDAQLKEIDAAIQEKQIQKDIIVANAGNRLYQVVGFLLFLGPAIYALKYYAWDKALGGLFGCAGDVGQTLTYCYPFRTDALSPEMAIVMTAALGMFTIQTTFGNKK